MLNFKVTILTIFAATVQFASAEPNLNADNTAINKRDQSEYRLTPIDQSKGSKSDIESTRKIRRMITKEKSISSNAFNVKIITLSGKTTLRGPVNSEAEKNRIGHLAANVVGVRSVNNQLEVQNIQ